MIDEIKKEVRTYTIEARHRTDKLDGFNCGGVLEFTGSVLTSYPPWYVHKCGKCGERINTRVQYPHRVYESTHRTGRE